MINLHKIPSNTQLEFSFTTHIELQRITRLLVGRENSCAYDAWQAVVLCLEFGNNGCDIYKHIDKTDAQLVAVSNRSKVHLRKGLNKLYKMGILRKETYRPRPGYPEQRRKIWLRENFREFGKPKKVNDIECDTQCHVVKKPSPPLAENIPKTENMVWEKQHVIDLGGSDNYYNDEEIEYPPPEQEIKKPRVKKNKHDYGKVDSSVIDLVLLYFGDWQDYNYFAPQLNRNVDSLVENSGGIEQAKKILEGVRGEPHRFLDEMQNADWYVEGSADKIEFRHAGYNKARRKRRQNKKFRI